MKKLPLLLLPFAVPSFLKAADPGVNDPMGTQTHADGWTTYFYDGSAATPVTWVNDADPYISVTHRSDGFDFVLDQGFAASQLVGDYSSSRNISGWAFDLYVGDPELVDSVSINFYASSLTEYVYSLAFPADNFPEEGWYSLEFLFSEPWYVFNQGANAFEEITLDDSFMWNLSEIGVTVFLVEGNTAAGTYGLDNFRTMPVVREPELEIARMGGSMELGFATEDPVIYEIQKFNLMTETWDAVAGQDNIVGDGNPYSYSVPLAMTAEIYRVFAEAAFTDLVWP